MLHRGATIANLMTGFSKIQFGNFHAEICYGENILTKNKKKANAQVKIELINNLDQKKVHKDLKVKTKVICDAHPVWDESFDMFLFFLIVFSTSPEDITHFRITIKSVNKLSKDEELGVVTVPIKHALNDDQPVEICGHNLYLRTRFVSALERNEDFMIANNYKVALTKLLCDKSHIIPIIICTFSTTDDSYIALIRFTNKTNFDSIVQNANIVGRPGNSAIPTFSRNKSKINVLGTEIDNSGLLAFNIVNEIVCDEVANGNSVTLFRTDSPATRICKFYFKLVGYKYLKSTLGDLIQKYSKAPSNLFELDPERITPEMNLAENAQRLINACTDFTIAIIGSENNIPLSIRKVLGAASEIEINLHSDSSMTIINLFFLRFICPAIMFPDQNNLCDEEIDPDSRRVLLLISKGIQSLVAFKGDFYIKEPFMRVIQPFIDNMVNPMTNFVRDLHFTPDNGPADGVRSVLSEEDYSKLLSFLVRKFRTIIPKALTSLDKIHKDEEWKKSAKSKLNELKKMIN